jgi:hypothetical protein
MLLEIEKYDENIFQQAINFWSEFDNESHKNISLEYKLVYKEIEKMPLFLNGWIGKFYTFFQQNVIEYEQDYINFLIQGKYDTAIKKMSELQSNRIKLHINPSIGEENFVKKLRIFFELFGEGTLFDSHNKIVHTMHNNNNSKEFENPLELIGYPIWHVFVRGFSLLDPINPYLWLDLDRSLYLAYEIQAKLMPDPFKDNNQGFTNANYEWLNEIRYYCSSLEFKEIDLLFYENFRPYIDKFIFK